MGSDWDFSPMKLMQSIKDNAYTKISQELGLDSSSETIQWLVGLYYDNDRNEFNIVMDSDFPTMASTTRRDFNGEGRLAGDLPVLGSGLFVHRQ